MSLLDNVEKKLEEKALWQSTETKNSWSVFADIQSELWKIKSSLSQETTPESKSKVQNNLKEFLLKLKSINIADKSKLDNMITGLDSWVELQRVEEIEKFVQDLNARESDLQQTDLQNLKDSLSVLSSSKAELSTLFSDTVKKEKQKLKDIIVEKAWWFGSWVEEILTDFDTPAKQAKGKFFDGIFDKIWIAIKVFIIWMFVPEVKNLFDQYRKIWKWGTVWEIAWETAQKAMEYSKEHIEEFKNKLREQFRNYVKTKLWKKDISDEKLNSVIDEYLNENEWVFQMEKFIKDVKNNWEWEYKVLDWFLDSIKGWMLMIKFFAKLLEKWVITLDEIAMSTWTDFLSYGKITVNLIKDSFSKLNWTISWDELSLKAESLNLNEHEKKLIMFMIYRKWGLFFNFAWSVAWFMTKWLLYPFAFVWQDMSQVWARWSSFTGNYKKQLDIIEKISAKIDPNFIAKDADWLKMLKNSFNELCDFYKFWWWYQDVEWDFKKSKLTLWEFMKTQPKEMQELAWKLLKQSDLWISDAKIIRWALATNCERIGWTLEKWTWDLISKVWGTFKWWLSEKYIYQSFGDEMSRTSKALSNLIRIDDLLWLRSIKNQFVDKIRLWESLSKQIGMSDNIILAFKDVNDFKSWSQELKVLLRKTPDAAKMLFWKLPIIAVAWMELNKDDPTFKSLFSDIMLLVPLVWPFMLMSSLWIRVEDNQLKMSWDVTSSLLWLWFFWYDTYHITKVAAIDWFRWVARAMAQPFVDIAELGQMMSRWLLYWWKFVKDSVNVAKNEWTINMFKYSWETIADMFKAMKWWKLSSKPALLAYVAILAWWTYFANEYGLFDSEVQKELKKLTQEWMNSWDFDKYQAELLKERSTMSDGEKSQQLSNIIRLRAAVSGIWDMKESDIKYDWKNIKIILKKLIPADRISIFKDDALSRLKNFWLVANDSNLFINVSSKDLFQDIANQNSLNWKKISLNKSDKIKDLNWDKIYSLMVIIDTLKNYGYGSVVDIKTWQKKNTIISMLVDYGYDKTFVDSFIKISDYISSNWYWEQFDSYIWTIVADNDDKQKIILWFKYYNALKISQA